MRINNIPEGSWSDPVTPAEDEIWQCISGSILITAEAAPAVADGIRLDLTGGIRIPAGRTVRYRSAGGSVAVLAREVLG